MTKQYSLIYLNNYRYMVDKEAEYPTKIERDGRSDGDWTGLPYVYNEYSQQVYIVFQKSIHNQWLILASDDEKLKLPLLPKVANEMEEEWEKYRVKRLSNMGNSHLWNQDEAYKSFRAGYKAASSKKYTEEDMFRAMLEASKVTYNYCHNLTDIDRRFKEYLQRLNLQPIAVEVEMEFKYSSEIFLPDRSDNSDLSSKETRFKVDENNFVKVKRWIYE